MGLLSDRDRLLGKGMSLNRLVIAGLVLDGGVGELRSILFSRPLRSREGLETGSFFRGIVDLSLALILVLNRLTLVRALVLLL